MLKVPDNILTKESLLDMDNKISSAEPGEARCSDLDVPLFTSDTFNNLIFAYVDCMTKEQLTLVKNDRIDDDTIILLNNLCHDILDMASCMILEDVLPQVDSWISHQRDTTNLSEASQMECNFSTVTEDDIEASFGNSLHSCLGEALGVTEETSVHSEQLRQLAAEEVAKMVNRTLSIVLQSTSSQQSQEPFKIETQECQIHDMIFLVGSILKSCLDKVISFESIDEVSLVSVSSKASSPDNMTVASSPDNMSQASSLDCLNDAPSPDNMSHTSSLDCLYDASSLDNMSHASSLDCLNDAPSPDNITVASSPDNISEASSPDNLTVASSPDYLNDASSPDSITVVKDRSTKLQETTQKSPNFVSSVMRFFKRRRNKVAPVCEVDTSKTHSEVVHLENRSTPLHQNEQKRPGIIRMLSAFIQVVKKPFTPCMCA